MQAGEVWHTHACQHTPEAPHAPCIWAEARPPHLYHSADPQLSVARRLHAAAHVQHAGSLLVVRRDVLP
jgi:hypothetical protein